MNVVKPNFKAANAQYCHHRFASVFQPLSSNAVFQYGMHEIATVTRSDFISKIIDFDHGLDLYLKLLGEINDKNFTVCL